MGAAELIQADMVFTLVRQLRQHWLTGFDQAWRDWKGAPSKLRDSTTQAAKILRTELGADVIPPQLKQDTVRVQLFNIAGRRNRDRALYIRSILNTPLRDAQGNIQRESVWSDALVGFDAPDFKLIINAWASLTSSFAQIVQDVVPDKRRMPTTMSTPSDFAWLDRAANLSLPADEQLLEAYRDLPQQAARKIITIALDQEASWRAAFVIASRCDSVVPHLLARLAMFHAPLARSVLARVSALEIGYYLGIFRDSDSREGKLLSSEFCEYLREGVTLVRSEDHLHNPAPASRAGHGQLLRLKPKANPLIVLFDVDLTRPEISFLGLRGTRLCICDWVAPCGQPCFTRVGLDGSVALVGSEKPPAPVHPVRLPAVPFVPGRALISPFEGMQRAAYLGERNRIGGAPCWEQYPQVPESPVSKKEMTFIAQFEHPTGGMAYLFLDYKNLIAAAIKQWD